MQDRIQSILAFWFQDVREKGVQAEHSKRWFARDADIDQYIHDNFLTDFQAAKASQLTSWQSDAQGCLALIILLDQFSRNLFRNSADAFAQDAQALAITQSMINSGQDKKLLLIERVFVYLPLEHSENKDMQALSVQQYQQLLQEASDAEKKTYQSFLDYAHQHKNIVDQYGRFPHRNSILGRISTPEEIKFLQQPNSSF